MDPYQELVKTGGGVAPIERITHGAMLPRRLKAMLCEWYAVKEQ
jgi:hypothetical protein